MVRKSLVVLAILSVLIFNSSVVANNINGPKTGTTSFIETVPMDNRTDFYEGEEVFFYTHLDQADIIWVSIYDIDGQAIEKKLAKKIKAAGKKQLYWSSIIPSKKGEYSYKFFCGITSIRHDSGTFSVSTGPSYEYVGPVGTCMKIKGNTPVSVTNNFSQKSAVFLFGFVRIFSPTDFRIVIKASEKVFKLELPGKTARTNGLIFSSINLPTGEYEYEIFAREKGIFVAIENTGGKFFID